jgi:methionyl aminopeptidase
MTVHIKSHEEIKKMRIAGRMAAEVLEMIGPHIKAGVTTEAIDALCHEHIVNVQGAIPAALNYRGFPKSVCTSVNDVVCHGIPGPKVLKEGDIINVDVAVIKDEYYGDTSKMFVIGKPSVAAERLIRVTREAMIAGIKEVKPGARLGDIGAVIEEMARANRITVVKEYCGHGVGRNFHEDPQVLHYGKRDTGLTLEPGMIFTIEPMLNLGKRDIKLMSDKWTVKTKDHSLSAQWEHTILVTESGYEVLTKRIDETDLD